MHDPEQAGQAGEELFAAASSAALGRLALIVVRTIADAEPHGQVKIAPNQKSLSIGDNHYCYQEAYLGDSLTVGLGTKETIADSSTLAEQVRMDLGYYEHSTGVALRDIISMMIQAALQPDELFPLARIGYRFIYVDPPHASFNRGVCYATDRDDKSDLLLATLDIAAGEPKAEPMLAIPRLELNDWVSRLTEFRTQQGLPPLQA